MSASDSSSWPTTRASNGCGADATAREGGPTLQTTATQWASPQARLGDNRGADASRWGSAERRGGWNLDDQVAALWPTPSAALTNDDEAPESFKARQAEQKARGINGNGAGMPLTIAAKDWPTPASRDWRAPNSQDSQDRRNEDSARGQQLPNFIEHCWPTPTNGDSKSSGSRNTPTSKANYGVSLTDVALGTMGNSRSTRPDPASASAGPRSSPSAPTSLRLSPAFVEWLMGWPQNWTIPAPGFNPLVQIDSGRLETASSLWLRQQRIALSELSWSYEPEPEAQPEMRQMELL